MKKGTKPPATEIVWDKGATTKIHPSVDYAGDTCYMGFILPVRFVYDKSSGFETKETEHLCIISCGGGETDIFIATENELAARGLQLKEGTVLGQSRFSTDGMEDLRKNGVQTATGIQDTYLAIKAQYQRFIELPHPNWYVYASCYTFATYFYKLFNTFPIWHVWGLKRTGKTKTGDLFAQLAYNGMKSGLISTSALFRVVNDVSCSIVYDESEDLAKSKDRQNDNIAVINSGYKKGSPVMKSVDTGKGWKWQIFDCFGPKVICNIYGISSDTLRDRTIKTVMKRSNDSVITNTEIGYNDPEFQRIRDNLYKLALYFHPYVKRTYDNIAVEGITARELELWKPILTFVKIVHEMDRDAVDYDGFVAWVKNEVISEKESEEEEEDRDSRILKAIGENMADGYQGVMATKDITESVITQFEVGEAPDWVTSRSIGWELRKLGFKPERKAKNRGWNISAAEYIDICDRLKVEVEDRIRCLKTSTTEITSLASF